MPCCQTVTRRFCRIFDFHRAHGWGCLRGYAYVEKQNKKASHGGNRIYFHAFFVLSCHNLYVRLTAYISVKEKGYRKLIFPTPPPPFFRKKGNMHFPRYAGNRNRGVSPFFGRRILTYALSGNFFAYPAPLSPRPFPHLLSCSKHVQATQFIKRIGG